MDLVTVKNKVAVEWTKMNEHQGIGSVEMFKKVYGFDYDTQKHRDELQPVSAYLTKRIRAGHGYKDYRHGARKVLYIKKTAIGGIDLIDKFIHVCDNNHGGLFNLTSFQKISRLIWEMKEEATVAKDFVGAAIKIGIIAPLEGIGQFRIISKSTPETHEKIKQMMVDNRYLKRIQKETKIEEVEVSQLCEPMIQIKKSDYDQLAVTISKQIEEISDLKRLKCELLDEVKSLRATIKTNSKISVVDPTALLTKANEQL